MCVPLRWIRISAAIALLVITASVYGDRAQAIQDSEDKVLFGPVGIALGEAARVSVYAIGNPDTLPWDFTVKIFNRRGVVIQERRLQVAPGVIGFIDVLIEDEENFPVERWGRRTMRAEIVGFNPQPDPPGAYTATLEVFSRLTGRTSIFLGGPDTLPAEHQ